jgi:hypothetical protein
MYTDYYMLASQVEESNVHIIRYAPRERVASARIIWDGDAEPYYILEQEFLTPFPSDISSRN